MTEPVPGQTPEPVVADDAATTPLAGEAAARQQPTETPDAAAGTAAGTAAGAADDTAADTAGGTTEGATAGAGATANPQELFGSLSLSAIEADIDRLMNDKMSELDGMLAGLEELVQKLEGEITNLEPPADDTTTP